MGKTVKERPQKQGYIEEKKEAISSAPAEERINFARQFKDARKSLKLTLQDIETITGLSDTFVSDFERGKRTINIDNMAKLAAAVGKTVSQLIRQ